MDRYIGLDAHASSCTVAVVGPSGQRLASHVVETNARAIVQVIRAVPKDRHLCLEEGTLAGWLFEILSSHVQEIVVTGVPQSRGPKNDKRDAFALAEMLRIGATPAKVYKKRGQFTRLAYLAKAYQILVADDVRVQNRIKSVMRSRGVQVAGSAVYSATGRVAYLDRLLPAARPMTDILYQQHDCLTNLRSQTQKDMITEARKHAAFRCVRPAPASASCGRRCCCRWSSLPTASRASASSGPTVGSPSSAEARRIGSAPAAASGSRHQSSGLAGSTRTSTARSKTSSRAQPLRSSAKPATNHSTDITRICSPVARNPISPS